METYKREFIEFMVRCGALTFGDFTTKSGRKTPYFINTGNYHTGPQMLQLGRAYALALQHALGDTFDNLYGPAYKGIPLSVATAMAMSTELNRTVTFTFNRKEAKDHGEGGSLIGYRYQGGERVVIIEDVVTAGTSVRETLDILKQATPGGVNLRGVVVSVDRMERGAGTRTALDELRHEFGLSVFAIVTIEEVIQHLLAHRVDGREIIDCDTLDRIQAYRAQYGA